MKTWAQILAMALALTLAAGCGQHPGPRFDPYASRNTGSGDFQTVSLTNRIDPALLKPPTVPFTLGPGDRISIEMIDETNTVTEVTVGPDGKIYYNLLPGVDVWGKTLDQTKDALQKGLEKYVRQPPQIAVSLRTVESRRFWVLGRVQTPGVFTMTNAVTILDALGMAGGSAALQTSQDIGQLGANDDLVDFRRSFIVRKGQLLPVDFQSLVEKGDLSQNIYLQPDDFLYFPPSVAREVYVIGAVGQPAAIPYNEGMTMVSAIAYCLGTVKEAHMSHVAIVRGSLTEPKVAIVNYKDVVSGQVPDVLLQPHDIVYVPYQPYRYLVRYANLILNTFVSSVAINEGVTSVNPNVPTVTGVFIPAGSGVTVSPTPSPGASVH